MASFCLCVGYDCILFSDSLFALVPVSVNSYRCGMTTAAGFEVERSCLGNVSLKYVILQSVFSFEKGQRTRQYIIICIAFVLTSHSLKLMSIKDFVELNVYAFLCKSL